MLIEIFSDIVCPWCYIGKRNLDVALDILACKDIELIWRPYQLYPNVPTEGVDRREFVRARFGADARADRIPEPIAGEAKAAGLEFNFAGIKTTPNTFQAHRMMELAVQGGWQHAMAEVLFRYYFCDGKNIGDEAVLIDAAAEVGLDRESVVHYLDSGASSEHVHRQLARANDAGVTGVPCYLLAESFVIPGAQPPDVLVQFISRARERLATL